jgi:UDP-sulfoquinovose synthase
LVKLGSMGEYGAPNIDVAEGFFEVEYRGRKDNLLFPRHAYPDWYHWSKVHDSGNVMMACEVWGLRSTDVMQGVVYGTRSDQMVKDELLTRFDFDAVFGTVINRFCAQAVIEHDLTVYAKGKQQRPFIALRDCLKCFMLTIENPPEKGEYRVFNQFDEVYSVEDVAKKVVRAASKLGLRTRIDYIDDPRVGDEEPKHYKPIREKLYSLGFEATHELSAELDIMLADLLRYRDRVVEKQDQIMPKVSWGEDSCSAPRKLVHGKR